MSARGKTVFIDTRDGRMDAWLTEAEGEPRGSVIICPEIFGVTEATRAIAARVASEGYDALALNLFYRDAPVVELATDDEGRKRGLALLNRVTRDFAVSDVASAMAFLRAKNPDHADIAIVGISAGGHAAYLATCLLDVRLGISFYGGWLTGTDIPMSQPEPTLALTPEMGRRENRLLYLVGGADFLINAEQRAAIESALQKAKARYEVVVYPDAGHAFLSAGASFDEAASADGWKRAFVALGEEMGGKKRSA